MQQMLQPSLKEMSSGEKSPWAPLRQKVASAGYPTSSHSGDLISGLENCGARVFHCGTKKTPEGWVTAGGRVLAIVAQGDTLDAARTKAHAEAAKVDFAGSQRRSDIGYANM